MSKSELCAVCKCSTFKTLFNKNSYDFLKCTNCGLVFLSPMPSEQVLDEYYLSKTFSGNYDLDVSKERDRSLRQVLAYALSEHDKGNLLDIGCFDGRLLEFAESSGFLGYGIELQSAAAKVAEGKFKGRVHCGVIEASSDIFSNVKFDVIIASGLLEHLRKPNSLFEFAQQRLVDGGLFIIQTPNESSFLRKLMGKYWFCWSAPEHTFYFSKQNIKIIAKAYGMNCVKVDMNIKFLRIGYIFDQLRTFGSEIHRLVRPLQYLLPNFIKNRTIPVYGGEMIVVLKKS